MDNIKVENNIDSLKDKVIEEALIENVSGAAYPEFCRSERFGEVCQLGGDTGQP